MPWAKIITEVLIVETTLWILVSASVQTFRVIPNDTSVIRGKSTLLRCAVDHVQGRVQWTKDGFALGFDRNIPGFSNYLMSGSARNGEFNLEISNAKLIDDADFQCQVGPANGHKGIRASAHLHVLIPPEQIEMVGYAPNSVVEIKPQQSITLTCVTKSGKPESTFRWYRNKVLIEDISNIEFSVEGLGNKLVNSVSKITLQPKPEDNNAAYMCEALNPASTVPLQVQISLSVQFPPGPPEIRGYQEGEVVRMGDTLALMCVSRGGNPLAQLVWYKNNREIDYSYITSNNEAVNKYQFRVDSTDNNAVYRCEASSVVTPEPMSTFVRLNVRFAPSKVIISGHQNAKAGETIVMNCITDKSNPPAEVTWVVNGQPVRDSPNFVTPAPDGGFITSANTTLRLNHTMMTMMVSCYATNEALGQTLIETVTLSVLYPPDPPTIFRTPESKALRVRELMHLNCVTQNGNPLPTLTWWKGEKRIEAKSTISNNMVSSEAVILVNESDNGAQYTCKASNSATAQALVANVKLVVYFPPTNVTITLNSNQLRAGQKVSLVCATSSSNPASSISWLRDGQGFVGRNNEISDGAWGGKHTKNILEIDLTPNEDLAVYTCQATNTETKESVHDAVTLSVKYKPVFYDIPADPLDIVEGTSKLINMSAKANPREITYSWIKDGSPFSGNRRITIQGPILNITTVHRGDAGKYLCEAKNEEGSEIKGFHLNVQYGASITRVNSPMTVEEGHRTFLECQAHANPMVDSLITWERADYDMSKVTMEYMDGKSILTINNTTKADSGSFTCIANNGLGQPDQKKVELIVKFKPIIDRAPRFAKSASEKGQTAKLICRAEGVPGVSFSWSRDNEVIDSTEHKYRMQTRLVQINLYEGVLSVSNITPIDYGLYDCIARNSLGIDRTQIKVDGTSRPDPPIDITVVNITHNSALIKWTPGFDGGLPQTFRVRYLAENSNIHLYSDVDPPDGDTVLIKGLQLDTEYEFTVRGHNKLGDSEFQTKVAKARTSSEPPRTDHERMITRVLEGKGGVPLIIIISVSIAGVFLLVLSVFLIICFIRRRRKKRLEEVKLSMQKVNVDETESSSSKPNSIEMYAPSGYTATTTGGTVSTISEKSDTYSDYSRSDYIQLKPDLNLDDDGRKSFTGKIPASSTYLVDSPDGGVYVGDNPPQTYTGWPTNATLRIRPNVPIISEEEDEAYTNALRKNAYNQNLTAIPKIPPAPPSRTTSTDPRYVPCPVPQPILSTFSPVSISNRPITPKPQTIPYVPSPVILGNYKSSDKQLGHLV